eukprot:TRINITY_DN12677_c0_g1_i1.p1 TRINITY_DN12677_c0_g1~~TRINITY_DN12677_c0_g1_i1.p1  ORF type:complete len:145 (+),score=12.60 TRINITY_DN12677_c0_g1_i1:66-500(+)
MCIRDSTYRRRKARCWMLKGISRIGGYGGVHDSRGVNAYSELVSNTETTFAGNPVKAAKRKRTISKERLGASNIYELMDTFKSAPLEDDVEKPKNIKIKSKLKLYQGAVPTKDLNISIISASQTRKSIKSRRGLSIIRMRNVKQ